MNPCFLWDVALGAQRDRQPKVMLAAPCDGRLLHGRVFSRSPVQVQPVCPRLCATRSESYGWRADAQADAVPEPQGEDFKKAVSVLLPYLLSHRTRLASSLADSSTGAEDSPSASSARPGGSVCPRKLCSVWICRISRVYHHGSAG